MTNIIATIQKRSIIVAMLLLFVTTIVPITYGATIKSTQSGNWSASTTWNGGTIPSDGDAVIIDTAGTVDTVTLDTNITVGSNNSSVGAAIWIKGSAAKHGVLKVNDGDTLTLKGEDLATDLAMLIDRYSEFVPLPGACIMVDDTGNYNSIIQNKGIITAVGTALKPITFSIPAANYSWNNDLVNDALSNTGVWYSYYSKLKSFAFDNMNIANAGGTALGTSASSSVSFSSQNPAGILATECAALADVNAAGEYWVNYELGYVVYYHNNANAATTNVTYKYLTNLKGWGISSIQNTTYNEAKFQYCNFYYMGKSLSANAFALELKYKYTVARAANQLAYIKNCVFMYNGHMINVGTSGGTAADLFEIRDNYFGASMSDGTFGGGITFYRQPNTYINIYNNTLNAFDFVNTFSYGAYDIDSSVYVRKNTGTVARFFVGVNNPIINTLPYSYIDSNVITGAGYIFDARTLHCVGGNSYSPITIRDNTFSYGCRIGNLAPYLDVERNVFREYTHHGWSAPTTEDHITNRVILRNNLFYNCYSGSSMIELGYNHRTWMDSVFVINNTAINCSKGIFAIGDPQDGASIANLTNIVCKNNISMLGAYAIMRNANDADEITNAHFLDFDYNDLFGSTTAAFSGVNRCATFNRVIGGVTTKYNPSGSKNILGVSLYDPTYSSVRTSDSLVYVYTDSNNATIKWMAGTPVQLVVDTGTATAGANTSTQGIAGAYSGSLTNTNKTYSTTRNTATCPSAKWIRIIGGTGAGQERVITNNTATVLTTVPAWSVTPSTDSRYAIWHSEVFLNDGATDSIRCGIDLRQLPKVSAKDTGIALVLNTITTNPQLTDSGATPPVFTLKAGSPAINAGDSTFALTSTPDFYGVVRIVWDIGATEYYGGTSGSNSSSKKTFWFNLRSWRF